MKILVAENKYDTEYYRWNTPHEQAASALALFKVNDGMSYYYDIEDPKDFDELENDLKLTRDEIEKAEKADVSPSYINKLKLKLSQGATELKENRIQHDLYVKAKAGDSGAALKLITLRKDAEYEGWTVKEVR